MAVILTNVCVYLSPKFFRMWEKRRQLILLVPILTLQICTVYLIVWVWGGSHVVYMMLDSVSVSCWVEPELPCSPRGRSQGILSPTVRGCWNMAFAYLWHCLQDIREHLTHSTSRCLTFQELSFVYWWQSGKSSAPLLWDPKLAASALERYRQDIWFDSDWVLSGLFLFP